MKLKVLKEDIIEGLQKSANIIPAKTGAAFLRTIWLNASESLQIMATDSNIEFFGDYPATVESGGLAGVQGRSFYDLVKKLPPGEIFLETDENNSALMVKQGRRHYKLPLNDPEWFQNFSQFPDDNAVSLSGDQLQTIIDRISFCISDEDTMEAVACISFKPLVDDQCVEICGMNGHQFAMIRLMNPEILSLMPEEGILIHKKYLLELKKWLTAPEVSMTIDNKRLFLKTVDGKETFSLPLSYYNYPEYKNFLLKLEDDDVSTVVLNRSELVDALERLLIFTTENNRCTYFEFEATQLSLTSEGQEVGSAQESLEVERSGEIPKIAFPTRNLIEILNHFETEQLNFTLTGSEGPCGIRDSNDASYLVIIMPMKIVEEAYYSEEEV